MSASTSTKYKIMQLSQSEYVTLSTTGTLTKDGVTYTYSPSDTIYVTPENTEYAPLLRTPLDLSSYTSNSPLDITEMDNGTYEVTAQGYVGYLLADEETLTKIQLKVGAIIGKQGTAFMIINNNNIYNGSTAQDQYLRKLTATNLNTVTKSYIDFLITVANSGSYDEAIDEAVNQLAVLGIENY